VGAGSVEDLRDALTSEREPLTDLSEREAVRAQRDDLPVAR
jgi:hypothetical protein